MSILSEPYLQRAVLAALFLGPLCGLLGVFVTARRMAFFSDTIAHAALAGVALGFWWGIEDSLWPLLLFSLAIAAALIWLKENTDLLTDTLMALLLSGSVALGVFIMSRNKNYRGELHRYLFGDILSITQTDVVIGAFLLVVLGTIIFYRLSALTLLTVHEDMAHVSGVRVRLLNYLFVVVLTLSVAMTIRLLGIVLVTALLVIPAAAARNVSLSLRQQIIFSLLLSLVGSVGGTILSYPIEAPPGSMIVLTCIALFVTTLVLRRFRASPVTRDNGRGS
jgi:ABC-type Mn2+/Zn2+ transport system permease subunit